MKLTESRIKQIIKEEMDLMEMDIDPTTLMLGAGGIYVLYDLFFGREPSNEDEALNAVRKHIEKLEAQNSKRHKPLTPPPMTASEKRKKAIKKLAQLKKNRET